MIEVLSQPFVISAFRAHCLWGVCCITSPELSLGLGQTANEVLLTSRVFWLTRHRICSCREGTVPVQSNAPV